jgi:MoaA/NifB/PqqE/SkfB family radical SAM enzyme/protein-L-isoaspartate O-methyltransferase
MRGDSFFTQLSGRAPFSKLHPKVAQFFKEYFQHEKVVRFNEQYVVNTNFPPYPSAAFDQLAGVFGALGDAATRRLYSVTLAVTNRCPFNCWHCYNAGRSQEDLPLATLKRLASDLQDLGTVLVTLTGGEPLLRADLEELVNSFDSRSCLILGTTGEGLTPERALALHQAGLFGVGISLDSDIEQEHDRLRGRPGAFRRALEAICAARETGLYPYVVAVATRQFLERSRFESFLRFAAQCGALEVHLLEPSATGRLAGRTDVLLSGEERQRMFTYQEEVALCDDLPIVSSFAYVESAKAFGCGAGLTHIYIDGSGEVCPCNLVPLSFGNIRQQSLGAILQEMGRHFCRPRTGCVGRMLAKHFPVPAPATPEQSAAICQQHLPPQHPLPAFFRLREEARGEVGQAELQAAYDRVHGEYDQFWLTEASRPVDDLIRKIRWTGQERVIEAGCGTGYATSALASKAASVLAVDLSPGMLDEARRRVASRHQENVTFRAGDALEVLRTELGYDLVFSSWVLGYIPLAPFFNAAAKALVAGGRLAFVVHKENSPQEPLEIFGQLVAEDPTVLQKRVAFDFPRNSEHVATLVSGAGLQVESLWEDAITFHYARAESVLEHLLKSGAGTAFYDAIDPKQRPTLTARFLQRLADRHESGRFPVCHEYVACIARREP